MKVKPTCFLLTWETRRPIKTICILNIVAVKYTFSAKEEENEKAVTKLKRIS